MYSDAIMTTNIEKYWHVSGVRYRSISRIAVDIESRDGGKVALTKERWSCPWTVANPRIVEGGPLQQSTACLCLPNICHQPTQTLTNLACRWQPGILHTVYRHAKASSHSNLLKSCERCSFRARLLLACSEEPCIPCHRATPRAFIAKFVSWM